MVELHWIPPDEFERVLALEGAGHERTALFASMCRLQVLTMVKHAGSGHLGTSFSCLDIVSWLMLEELRLPQDIVFSSKGHDAPAFYAALAGLGRLDPALLRRLRRRDGLPGHPEVRIPFMEANTGSLGMGISKAKGMAEARRRLGPRGRIVVLTGDGELQEGQIWESLVGAANRGLSELTVIVDRNAIQSDTWVARVCDLGDLPARFSSCGWQVARCDGHDVDALARAWRSFGAGAPRPRVILADTIKGRGVSFMERFEAEGRFYAFHSGAPDDDSYERALAELRADVESRLARLDAAPLRTETQAHAVSHSPAPRQRLVEAWSRTLVAHAEREPRLVALDADLVKDCGLGPFAERFPERFIECGIAEQDMVSQAGGLALKGLLPVVHSFACFLSARPNEQIYTNATEGSHVVHVATLAGLLPGTPGHSHQAVRDISALGAMPGMELLAPATEREVELCAAYLLERHAGPGYLRLCSIPWIVPFATPERTELRRGRGWALTEGSDGVLFAYGPVMLSQAFDAIETLRREHGVRLKLVNLPWLNVFDLDWLADVVAGQPAIFTLDDHYLAGGQGERLLAELARAPLAARVRAFSFGVEGLPAGGQNDEVLAAHRLDAASLDARLREALAAGR